MRSFALASLVVVGCGGPRPTDPVPAPVTPDAGAVVAAIVPDAAPPPPPDAAPPPPPDAAPAPTYTIPSAPRPAVKGKPAPIEEDQEIVSGGLSVKFDYASHKHGGDHALGMWGFVVSKGGKSEAFELRSGAASGWQAEVGALGRLLVLTHVSYTEFTVTVVPGKLPARLDDDAAMQMIDDAAAAAGLPTGDGSSASEDNGILRVRAYAGDRTLWRAYVGLYSRRIWFTE